MAKIRVVNYTFNAAGKTITFTDYGSILLDAIYAVVNSTTQQIIYNPSNTSLGGTVATNVLTLEGDTTGMNNTDKLLIIYDDAAKDPALQTTAQAISDAQTDGTQKSIARGGAKGTTTAADVTSTASGANRQLLDMALYDASGNQITSFGGGGSSTTLVTKTVTITRPADTTTYADGDALSNSTSAPTSGGFTITGAASASGKSGVITHICAISSNSPATKLICEIWVADTALTNINDNAAFTLPDSERLTLVGKIPLTFLDDAGGLNSGVDQEVYIPFTTVGSADLRFVVKVRNAYVPANAEVITFRFKIEQYP